MAAIVEPFISSYSGELPSCRSSHDSLHEPLPYMFTPKNLPLVIDSLILLSYWTVDSIALASATVHPNSKHRPAKSVYPWTRFTDDHYYVQE